MDSDNLLYQAAHRKMDRIESRIRKGQTAPTVPQYDLGGYPAAGTLPLICVGTAQGGVVMAGSVDGDIWQFLNSAWGGSSNADAYAVTYDTGHKKWIVGGDSDGSETHVIQYSTNGIDWTVPSTPFDNGHESNEVFDLAYSPSLNRVVAISDFTGSDTGSSVMTSDDGGVTWTLQHTAWDGDTSFTDVIWVPFLSMFVAGLDFYEPGGPHTTNYCIATSPDGITWTAVEIPPLPIGDPHAGSYQFIFGMGCNGSRVIICGNNWQQVFWRTDNASTFTEESSPPDVSGASSSFNTYDAAYSPELDMWVAGTNDNENDVILTSTDNGVSWTTVNTPMSGAYINAVLWSETKQAFYGVGSFNSGLEFGNIQMILSEDGATWRQADLQPFDRNDAFINDIWEARNIP